MGLLTAAQLAAIPGSRVRQTWSIIRPTSAGATPSSAVVMGTTDTLKTGDTKPRVIDCGRRTNSAGNVSPKVFGDISSQDYSIVLSNDSGYFYRATSGGAWWVSGSYTAQPRECWLKHEVEVWDGDSWEHLPCSPWTGKILDVTYDDVISAVDGSSVGATATISAVGYLSALLKQPWSAEAHTQITQGIDDYDTPTLLVSDITRGWRVDGFTNHIWLQLTTSAACSCRLTVRRQTAATTWYDTTSSGTLHQFDVDTGLGAGQPVYSCALTVHITVTSGGAVYTYGYPLIPLIYSSEAASVRPW